MCRFCWHLRQPSPNACSHRAFHSLKQRDTASICMLLLLLFFFWLSVTFSTLLFLVTLKPECIRMSDSKLVGAFANQLYRVLFKRAEYAACTVKAAASCGRKVSGTCHGGVLRDQCWKHDATIPGHSQRSPLSFCYWINISERERWWADMGLC